mmetsp:Transcript_5068/g.9419  ORF Transcript_5068/g.9419 Transcript_5068/m.9419 type:complete len:83 (+) Transcript_5068:190-438(+)
MALLTVGRNKNGKRLNGNNEDMEWLRVEILLTMETKAVSLGNHPEMMSCCLPPRLWIMGRPIALEEMARAASVEVNDNTCTA